MNNLSVLSPTQWLEMIPTDGVGAMTMTTTPPANTLCALWIHRSGGGGTTTTVQLEEAANTTGRTVRWSATGRTASRWATDFDLSLGRPNGGIAAVAEWLVWQGELATTVVTESTGRAALYDYLWSQWGFRPGGAAVAGPLALPTAASAVPLPISRQWVSTGLKPGSVPGSLNTSSLVWFENNYNETPFALVSRQFPVSSATAPRVVTRLFPDGVSRSGVLSPDGHFFRIDLALFQRNRCLFLVVVFGTAANSHFVSSSATGDAPNAVSLVAPAAAGTGNVDIMDPTGTRYAIETMQTGVPRIFGVNFLANGLGTSVHSLSRGFTPLDRGIAPAAGLHRSDSTAPT